MASFPDEPTPNTDTLHAHTQTPTKSQTFNNTAKPKAPRKKPAAKMPQAKSLLSEDLGGGLAQILMTQATDIDSMNIIQRLQFLKGDALLGPRFIDFNQSSTTVVTTSISSRDILSPAHHNVCEHHQQCISTSMTVSFNASSMSLNHIPAYPKRKNNDIHTFTLDDFTAISALGSLVERFGKVSHMGILDPSYRFFMTKDRQAALYYKVRNNVAVVGGDPLCEPAEYDRLLEEFRRLRKRRRWGMVFLGATDEFASYASKQKWVTMRFGTERVLNPLNNPVLQEKEQKRMITQNKQLLDPEKGGISVHAYAPAQGRDENLERELRQVYDLWRESRNQSGQPQAYMTVFDPFAIPMLMTYLYTTDRQGQCNGFAALRKIGANKGYHIDPYCSTPAAPKGITDLLVFSAMSLLQQAGIGYLSFGFEPATQLDEVTGLSRPTTALTKSCYRRAFRHLPIGGKKAYHDKFRPDPALDSGLHIIYPSGAPSLQDALATLHFANVEVRELLKREILGACGWKPSPKQQDAEQKKKKGDKGEEKETKQTTTPTTTT
ncbi:uncharacterized protein Z520_02172 [Fonsecaea multimorphosa CBS 102226]|uniref:Phosphatidylglycerol lysyltransferase C-terminal domain-containing protein n=1 Tax=Fonsecaea multimorphosa CBS 102226 TaxID=1442371 RepID=A0A0D2KYZ2_9EURO|nr:uncharacterized protein Z520_02172 [Fonsecaea multimorphosa CBS 102226]KIY02034.1 hypothetical protein Z520_02172 [Fonsecaea multimorphosa CBS 102226]OAL29234.1 hypothetical protein AYO22_02128 [Fonsecaea multimorphosa]